MYPAYSLSDALAGMPHFTDWIVSEGYLSTPFVLLDVGVNGGFHLRWRALGDCLHAIGFDAVPAVIEHLESAPPFPGKTEYRNIALGEVDAEQTFFVDPQNTTRSGFFTSDAKEALRIKVRSLDSLHAANEIPAADFIKIDCEGADPLVLRGARKYIPDCRSIGLQSEASFRTSAVLPHGHFGEIFKFCTENFLELYSMIHDRHIRAAYAEAAGMTAEDIVARKRFGQIGTSDALFISDVVTQRDSSGTYTKYDADNNVVNFHYVPPTTDKLIKLAIIFELYGLRDCAFELITAFSGELGSKIDTEKARNLLVTL